MRKATNFLRLGSAVLLLGSATASAQDTAATTQQTAPPAATTPTATPPVPTAGSAQPAPAATETTADAQVGRLKVVRETLDNGMRVVMSPDRTVPTVAVALYFDVGSRNEERGRSGFAHLFEHMMFQGSHNVGKGEHFQLIMNRGGSANGTTSHDRTNYYETLPSSELALGLWLEADRMKSLAVTQENFENQRQTVMEERRQSYDNRPYMNSMLRINQLAYGDYWPYSHSTIGDMSDLQKAPLAAVQEFFTTYYAPNNAVLGISGDFEPAEAMALVKKHFGDVPRRDTPQFTPEAPRPQTAERTDTIMDPLAELPAFHIAYHVPPDRHVDHYPLEMLAIILGDGESSRLYQELVKDKEVLQQIHVNTDGRRGPDLFSVWAICAKGHSGDKAREAIYKHLKDVARKGVTERELQKAKNRVRSAFIFGMESNLQRAQRFAEFEMYFGKAELLLDEADLYLKVTVDDIKRVAEQYFAPTNRTVLDVLPAKAQGPKAARATGGGNTTAAHSTGSTQ